jgi:UDP-N-acetylmuramate dehydrogenase
MFKKDSKNRSKSGSEKEIKKEIKKEFGKEFEEKIKRDVLLKPYTSLGIGGGANYFVEADTQEIIFEAVKWAKRKNIPLFTLGGGSNLVISDRGFLGLVVHINTKGIEVNIKEESNQVLVTIESGEIWDDFVSLTVENNWQGVECLSGIPGKVGATPIQNVGAYGQEVKDTIIKLQAYDRELEKIVTFSKDECEFSYRQSFFKSKAKDRYIILNVTYLLDSKGTPKLNYPELEKYVLEKYAKNITLLTVRHSVLELRRSKAMVLDKDDPNSKSVGSFFTNPIVEEEKVLLIKNNLLKENFNGNMPIFPFAAGRVKLSAAWLIEMSGFKKGYQKGMAAISAKHALALINKGDAQSREIFSLAEEIQEKVKNKFDIWLEPEPIYVGLEK